MHENASIGSNEHWANGLVERMHAAVPGELIFFHQGKIDRSDLDQLLALAEERSIAASDGVILRKRLYNVLVEGLENVQLHTPTELSSTGFALLVRQEDGYRIALGNALPLASALSLTHRVAILNDMDEADLREHYLKLLANEGRTAKGGAGLGLLTMARKCASPIVTHTVSRDPDSAYVALELALS